MLSQATELERESLKISNKIRDKRIKEVIATVDDIIVTFEDGSSLRQKHFQDCCETVEAVDFEDLVNAHGEVAEFQAKYEDSDEQSTAVFYSLVTNRGTWDWRWVGSSNGYYCEEAATWVEDAEGEVI